MTESLTLLEEIAVAHDFPPTLEGVVAFLNARFAEGHSVSQIERDYHLGQSYVATFCARRGIELDINTSRKATLKT